MPDVSWLHVAGFILGLLLILAGTAGTILPVIPGLPLAWLGFLVFGLFDKWQSYGWGTMIATLLIVAGAMAVDSLAGVMGAKKFGAGKPGMIGSVAGAIVGVIFFSLPGLIIGTFLGAVLAEMAFGRELKAALSAGTGAFVGFLAGSFFKFMIGLVMLGAYLWFTISPIFFGH